MLSDVLGHDTVLTIQKWEDEECFLSGRKPYEVLEHRGNLLTSGGVSAMWLLATGGAATAFSNANAYVGVGDSTTASTSGMTDLQAATNKLRKAMSAGSPGLSGNSVTFQGTYATSEGNFAWNEFAVFNASASGTMLNRVVYSGGTKPAGQVWAAQITIALT